MAKKDCVFMFETENEEQYIIFAENKTKAKKAMDGMFVRPTDYDLKVEICPIKKGSYFMMEGGRVQEWSLNAKITP